MRLKPLTLYARMEFPMPSPHSVNARPTVQTGLTHFRMTSSSPETTMPIGDEPYESPGEMPGQQPDRDPDPATEAD